MQDQTEQVVFRATGRECRVRAPKKSWTSALFFGAMSVPYVLDQWRPWDDPEPMKLGVDPAKVNVVSMDPACDALWEKFRADDGRRIDVEAEVSRGTLYMTLGFQHAPDTRVRLRVETRVDALLITLV